MILLLVLVYQVQTLYRLEKESVDGGIEQITVRHVGMDFPEYAPDDLDEAVEKLSEFDFTKIL